MVVITIARTGVVIVTVDQIPATHRSALRREMSILQIAQTHGQQGRLRCAAATRGTVGISIATMTVSAASRL